MSQGMIPTPMVLRRDSNHGPSRGLIKMSAFWLLVLINSSHIIFSSTKSRMKWYQISIYLDFECWTRFLDRLMALCCHKWRTYCLKRFHNHEVVSLSTIVEHNNSLLQYILLQPLIETLNFVSCSSKTPNYFQGRNNLLRCFFYHQHTRPNQHPSIQLGSHSNLLSIVGAF